MPKENKEKVEFPKIPKFQITRGKMLHDYLLRNDPEYREKYGKKR